MLDPSRKKIVDRLRKAMKQAGVSRVRLAADLAVTPQAIHWWLQTGKISRERISAVAAYLNVSAGYLMGDETPSPRPSVAEERACWTNDDELGELSQAEIDLVRAHRQVPTFVHDQIEGVIRGYLDHVAKDVAAFMGPRDLERQRSIEPTLVTKQIAAQSKDLLKATPPRKPKKPDGKKKRGKEGNHND